MAANISDQDWEMLSRKAFNTASLLQAVDAVDELRGHLDDTGGANPPQLRSDLLRLHRLAMAVFSERSRGHAADLFACATELEDQAFDMMTLLEQVQEVIGGLAALCPESLFDDDPEPQEAPGSAGYH